MGAHRCWIEVINPEKNEPVAVKWSDIISVDIDLSLYAAADSFNCILKNDFLLSDYFKKDQEISFWLGSVSDPNHWSKEDLTHVFTGRIDGVRPYFGEQMIVQLVGRDYSGRLIDREFSVAYAEQTASQIAAKLAVENGLTVDVTETEVVIEKDLYKDRKEWEILQELADREGFVCYVKKNKILYFGPRKETDDAVIAELNYKQKEKSNVLTMQFDNSMVGIINYVVVRHWLGWKKKIIQGEAKDEDLMKYGEKKRVVYDPKAITKELADQIAANKLKEWSRGVVTAEQVRIPGSPLVDPEKKVVIKGCGQVFDGNYYIEKARHIFSKSGGFFTEMNLTSQRPDSAAQYRKDLYD